MSEQIKIERRGRPRTRPVEKWDEIEKNYMREYVKRRRNDPEDSFKLIQSRTYYRKIFKGLDESNPRYEKISQKLIDLDTKIAERQAKRVRYQKQNILENVEV